MQRWLKARDLAPVCGFCAAALGALALAGWLLHIVGAIRLSPDTVPMQFNTALGLFIAGLSLALLNRHARAAGAGGVLLVALGGATLFEYAAGRDLGIDQLLLTSWLPPMSGSAGRMSINGALCLVVAGVAIATAAYRRTRSSVVALSGGLLLASVSMTSLVGYLAAIEGAYRWGGATAMAPQTALAFILLGAGLCAWAWQSRGFDRKISLALAAGASVALLSILVWQGIVTDQDRERAAHAQSAAASEAQLTAAHLSETIAALARFADRWSLSLGSLNLEDRPNDWNHDLKLYLRDFPELTALGWMEPGAYTTTLYRRSRKGDIEREDDAEFSANIFRLVGRKLAGADVASDLLESNGGAIGLVVAVRRLPSSPALIAILDPGVVLQKSLGTLPAWETLVSIRGRRIGGQPEPGPAATLQTTRLIDQNWTFALFAKPGSEGSTLPKMILFAGLIIACFTGITVYFRARMRERTEELRASNENFRAVVNGVKDYAIIMLGPGGRVASWNAGAGRIKGYTAAQIVGKHFSCFYSQEDIDHGHPDAELRTALAEGQFEDEGWRVKRDGSRFWASVLITAVRDSEGELLGFSKITRDITVRRALEQELREKNEMLVDQIGKAQQANRAKSEFLAVMSHEIRTPMNSILGMADLLWESDLDGQQRHYVEVFRRAGSDLMALIGDILDLSKIESNRLELERVEFDLEDQLEQAAELIAIKAHAKHIGLVCKLQPATATRLIGDPTRLRQVLVNLLGNAVKFTEAGEVVLSVRNRENGETGEIEFSVADTGIGIPPDKLETIFEAFSQADSSTTRRFGGTGLGLAISRRLVERMGGTLRASSVMGHGSTFRFSCRFDVAAESARKTPVARAEFDGRRAIVIDADPTDRLILHETLSAWGLASREFTAVEEGLAELTASLPGSPYSLVIVADQAPEADGFQAAARVREVAKDIPIILLGSDALPGHCAQCQELNISGHAIKPVRRTDLLRLVFDALTAKNMSSHVVTTAVTQAAPNPVPGVTEGGKALRILIAEDSVDNRLLLKAYLKGSPHELTFVENGRAAVESFTTGAFDLILMDMQMPVMDGLDATRAIRAIERNQGLARMPIIALTANVHLREIEMTRDAGCDIHLSKPISRQKILETISAYQPANPVAVSPVSRT